MQAYLYRKLPTAGPCSFVLCRGWNAENQFGFLVPNFMNGSLGRRWDPKGRLFESAHSPRYRVEPQGVYPSRGAGTAKAVASLVDVNQRAVVQ